MITLDELCRVLDSLEIPWANEGFTDDEKPPLPYISLQAGYGETLYADNIAFLRFMPCEILLYTPTRDYALEDKISDALEQAGCAFEKTITRIDAEHVIEAAFSVNVFE